MSAPGTPKASQAAITAVQEALARHELRPRDGRARADSTPEWVYYEFPCSCGEVLANGGRAFLEHVAVAAADAAAPHNAADALDGFLQEARTLRPCGCSIYRNALMCCVTSTPAKTEVRLVGPWREASQ